LGRMRREEKGVLLVRAQLERRKKSDLNQHKRRRGDRIPNSEDERKKETNPPKIYLKKKKKMGGKKDRYIGVGRGGGVGDSIPLGRGGKNRGLA